MILLYLIIDSACNLTLIYHSVKVLGNHWDYFVKVGGYTVLHHCSQLKYCRYLLQFWYIELISGTVTTPSSLFPAAYIVIMTRERFGHTKDCAFYVRPDVAHSNTKQVNWCCNAHLFWLCPELRLISQMPLQYHPHQVLHQPQRNPGLLSDYTAGCRMLCLWWALQAPHYRSTSHLWLGRRCASVAAKHSTFDD